MKMKLVKKSFDFNNVPSVHKLVNRVAQIIVKDVKDGVAKGVDINDNNFDPLKPSTIKAKKSRGSKTPTKPLLDTHRMAGKSGGKGIYLDQRASKGKHRATIKIPADRQYVGGVHNEGLGDMPKREWFGISKRAVKRADKMVKEFMRLLYKVRGK